MVAHQVNLRTVAELAGVSPATVSLILNGKGDACRYSRSTQARVKKAAASSGFKPNILGRSLVTRRSQLVGVLFSHVNYAYFSEFGRGLQETLAAHRYAPVLFVHHDRNDELRFLEECLDRRVDALIVNAAVEDDGSTNAARFSALKAQGMPMVEVLGSFLPGVPSFKVDSHGIGYHSTRDLIREGHRRIVLYTHSRVWEHETKHGMFHNEWEHMKGYEAAMAEEGLEPTVIAYPIGAPESRPGYIFRAALASADKVLAHRTRPTAAACLNSEASTALLIKAARSRGSKRKFLVGTAVQDDRHMLAVGNSLQREMPLQELARRAAEAAVQAARGNTVEGCVVPVQECSCTAGR